jgi:hypothetical protein
MLKIEVINSREFVTIESPDISAGEEIMNDPQQTGEDDTLLMLSVLLEFLDSI